MKNKHKKRKPLPKEYELIYQEHLLSNRSGKGVVHAVSIWLERWMHRQVAKRKDEMKNVLEIGAGNLNHIQYEKFKNYDVVEPNNALLNSCDVQKEKTRNVFRDISETLELKYERVISIAVLEHLENLSSVVGMSKKILLEGGIFQSAIPTEGGWLWHVVCIVIKGYFFKKKYGLNYRVLMADHILNTEEEIISTVRNHFETVRIKRFPTPFRHLSLYTYIEAS